MLFPEICSIYKIYQSNYMDPKSYKRIASSAGDMQNSTYLLETGLNAVQQLW